MKDELNEIEELREKVRLLREILELKEKIVELENRPEPYVPCSPWIPYPYGTPDISSDNTTFSPLPGEIIVVN